MMTAYCTSKSELPLREPDQLAIPSPPNQLIILFTGLRHGVREMRYAIIIGASLAATDEDALGFNASGSTPPRIAFLCIPKARINEEIPQHIIQRRANVLSR
jgi:hypothetical protein